MVNVSTLLSPQDTGEDTKADHENPSPPAHPP